MDPKINLDIPISKKTVGDILEPALVPLSQALGGIIHWVFQKPIEYGVVKTQELKNLKLLSEQYLNAIPLENRTSDNLGLTLKAFEDSRYQLNNENVTEYFAKLIAGTVDNRKSINPIYSSILSEMSSEDARLLQYFYSKKYLFENVISHSNPAFADESYRYYSPKRYYVISGNYEEGQYREPEEFGPLLSKEISSVDISNSFIFLKSKGLIDMDETQNSHVLIHSVQNKSLNEDEWLQETLNNFKLFKYNRITEQKTTVYTLTSLGANLANLVCQKDK